MVKASLDWVKKGWGDSLSQEFSQESPFVLDFSASKENDRFPFDAAVDAVKRIAENYPGPYTVMASGGVDSQAVLLAWMASGIPFKILAAIYVDETGRPYNQDDLLNLFLFTNKHGLKVEYRRLEVFSFIEKELEHYVTEYQCTSPQLCTHMKISEFVEDGTIIFSGNFFDGSPSLNYTVFGLYRYAMKRNNCLIPFFFLHDPELVGSFHYFCRTLKLENINSAYERKCETYRLAGFDVIPQEKKMTGFELIKEYYDDHEELVNMKDRLQFAKYASDRIFDLRFRYHFTRTVKYVDPIVHKSPSRKE